ncbi:MAG: hypothetical protein C4B59_02690 [Candidatus Methanogaster sp.]|uniref:Uncharacterized protein n=1 Tax=Candidatus Methanogaster sp. TaxID=3386292 RepID=A0AC61L5X9_9EURY|nr:MAG: hypothetical protein C4B59_02690 [ANME-2 cluster archaeon]
MDGVLIINLPKPLTAGLEIQGIGVDARVFYYNQIVVSLSQFRHIYSNYVDEDDCIVGNQISN